MIATTYRGNLVNMNEEAACSGPMRPPTSPRRARGGIAPGPRLGREAGPDGSAAGSDGPAAGFKVQWQVGPGGLRPAARGARPDHTENSL